MPEQKILLHLQRDFFLSEMENNMNLCLVYDSKRKMKCVFYTVIIKNESLIEHYEGGLQEFIEKYYCARCNEYLSVVCYMGVADADETVDDLLKNGLEMIRDFKIFDATRLAMDINLCLSPSTLQEDLNLGVDWLKCIYDHGSIWVWHSDQNWRFETIENV